VDEEEQSVPLLLEEQEESPPVQQELHLQQASVQQEQEPQLERQQQELLVPQQELQQALEPLQQLGLQALELVVVRCESAQQAAGGSKKLLDEGQQALQWALWALPLQQGQQRRRRLSWLEPSSARLLQAVRHDVSLRCQPCVELGQLGRLQSTTSDSSRQYRARLRGQVPLCWSVRAL
jgi:hypothetical protein